MRPVAGVSSYSRTVTVKYVDPNLVAVSPGTTTDRKQVTVCASGIKMQPICLDTVIGNR